MKIRSILITIGAAALAAITTNALADNGALSPRAAGNQIIHTVGTSNGPDLVAQGLTSTEYAAPRLAGNAVVKVADTGSAVNRSTLCTRNSTASPKAIQACAANPLGPMPCCNVAAAR